MWAVMQRCEPQQLQSNMVLQIAKASGQSLSLFLETLKILKLVSVIQLILFAKLLYLLNYFVVYVVCRPIYCSVLRFDQCFQLTSDKSQSLSKVSTLDKEERSLFHLAVLLLKSNSSGKEVDFDALTKNAKSRCCKFGRLQV